MRRLGYGPRKNVDGQGLKAVLLYYYNLILFVCETSIRHMAWFDMAKRIFIMYSYDGRSVCCIPGLYGAQKAYLAKLELNRACELERGDSLEIRSCVHQH